MLELLRSLTAREIIALAAGVIAVLALSAALASPRGWEAFALLGLRIADALTQWLEAQLSASKRHERMTRRTPRAHT